MSILSFPRSDRPAHAEARAHGRRAHLTYAPSDAELAQRIRDGDTEALDALMERYWVALTTYADRLLDDLPLAEDVVQDTLVRLWEGRARLKPRALRSYLFRCTRNRALDARRHLVALRRREGRAHALPHDPPTPDDVMRENALAAVVDGAIQALSERRREAFTLTYLKGLSYEETADVMGLSAKTVGNHVTAALAELRASLGSSVLSEYLLH